MEADWQQSSTSGPGLFPVYLYRNEESSTAAEQACTCGYECTSGACCCFLGSTDLACGAEGASCEASTAPIASKRSLDDAPNGSQLLTLAIAASTIPETLEQDEPRELKSRSGKTCRRCIQTLPLSAFCTNTRASDGLYTQCRACVSQKDQERRAKMKGKKTTPKPSKICSRCQVQKKSYEFYLDKSRPDGMQTYCKPCFSETYREKRRLGKA